MHSWTSRRPIVSLVALSSVFLLPCALFSQGDLTPPGAPTPTQKSLQEIWDKIGGLETKNAQLQALTTQLQTQVSLLAASTVNFAWIITTIDSPGNVGQYT